MRSINYLPKVKYVFFLSSILLVQLVFGKGTGTIQIDHQAHALVAPTGCHYQWFKDGEPLQGQRNQTLEIAESGTYSVEIGQEDGNTSEVEATVAVTATGAIVRIYTIGDSTVQDYTAGYYPRRGYGQELPFFFNTANVQVLNKAVGGTSSKSFYNDYWAAVRNALQPGDFVFIAFGINDRNSADTARYAPTGGVFEGYLTKFVNETKAKGGFPVLLTPSRRGSWQNGQPYDAWHDHPIAVRTVAKSLGVPLIDVDAKQKAVMIQMGEGYIARYWHNIYEAGEYPNYPNGNNDDLHLQEMGAIETAKMVVEGITELSTDKNVKTLIPYIKPQYEVKVTSDLAASDSLITRTLSYPQGVTVTLKTIPKKAYLSKFLNWNGASNKNVSTKTLYSITMGTAATNYTAHFKGGVVTGLEETMSENRSKASVFYPNPFEEALQLETSGTYSIYDVYGILLEKGSCEGKCTIGQRLPKGAFLLEFENMGTSQRVKITKQ